MTVHAEIHSDTFDKAYRIVFNHVCSSKRGETYGIKRANDKVFSDLSEDMIADIAGGNWRLRNAVSRIVKEQMKANRKYSAYNAYVVKVQALKHPFQGGSTSPK